MEPCPVCTIRCRISLKTLVPDTIHYNCKRCGEFLLPGSFVASLPNLISTGKVDRGLLSHHIRKLQSPGKQVMVRQIDLDFCADLSNRPAPKEQLDRLILWVGDNQSSPEAWAIAEAQPIAATIGAGVTPNNETEPAFQWLFNENREAGLFRLGNETPGKWSLRLTMNGWSTYEQLKRKTLHSRRAFMAMQFNDPLLERVLKDCFKPAVAAAGFDLRALNEEQPAGLIDNQIRAAIRTAQFVIADLTHGNNGAYFEAGFAEGLPLPVIYTCEQSKFDKEKTHFDTNHMVTIPWSADALPDAAKRLTATIRATLPGEAKME